MSYPVMSTSVPWSLVKSGFHKTPSFEGGSMVQEAASGRGNTGLSLKPYATWAFNLDINLVQGGEAVQASVLQQFIGCFMACCGRAGLFLFTDPNDCAVESPDGNNDGDQSMMIACPNGALQAGYITGDGSTTQFQLARTVDQGVDILQTVSNVVVFVNGAPTTVTVGSTGVVTFSSPPPANAVLTWQGAFRYLCRFSDDSLKDLARVNKNSTGFLWSCGSVAFESEFV
jgi:uncharacterized protein (TIGR02217 family)